MNYCSRWYRSALAGIALIAGLGFFSTPAVAAFLGNGTTTAGGISANTTITNQATLNYSIAGTGQPAVTSTATTFVVDNKVNVQVTEVGGAFTAVAPLATSQITTFLVTNTGNSPMDYSLAVNGAIASGQTLFGETDSFDVGSCVARVESGATGGFQVAEDTAAAILNLSPVAPGNTATVYVLCTIPAAANLAASLVALTATTADHTSCNATGASCVTTIATAGADTPGAVDIVFADAAGSDDPVRDGKHSARDVYKVLAAVISVSKTVTAICDPFNGAASPKSIPGAYVRYEITVANAVGAAAATLTDITDALNGFTAFDADLRTGAGGAGANLCTSSTIESATLATPLIASGAGFRLRCTGTTRSAVAGTCAHANGQYFTTAADGDAMFFAGAAVTVRFGTGGGTVTGAQALPAEGGPGYGAGELKGGESVTIRFNAIIN